MKVKREWYDAIKFRHSRRTYEKKIISKGNRLKIIQLIDDINAESGLNLQFIEDGEQFLTGFNASYGMITGTNYLIALVGNRNLKNLKKLPTLRTLISNFSDTSSPKNFSIAYSHSFKDKFLCYLNQDCEPF